jgi:hypothetical protein
LFRPDATSPVAMALTGDALIRPKPSWFRTFHMFIFGSGDRRGYYLYYFLRVLS